MRWLMILTMCTGCMLPSLNQEGLQLVVNDLQSAQTTNSKVASKLAAVVLELNTAAEQERSPVVAPLIQDASSLLLTTADSLDQAGKTAVTLQTAIGTPKDGTVIPTTVEQKEMWRTRYVAIAKMFAQIKTWAQSKLPIPYGITTKQPAPWSASDIAALIVAITTGAGTLGIGGKKVITQAQKSKQLSIEAEQLADHLKTKCNGDGEFASIMSGLPTIVRDHRERKANEL